MRFLVAECQKFIYNILLNFLFSFSLFISINSGNYLSNLLNGLVLVLSFFNSSQSALFKASKKNVLNTKVYFQVPEKPNSSQKPSQARIQFIQRIGGSNSFKESVVPIHSKNRRENLFQDDLSDANDVR